MDDYINTFLNNNNYDIRQLHNGRWIDQKCTPDVLCIIADCIIEYAQNNVDVEYFSSVDIWHYDYAVNNVEDIFKKPNLNEKRARSEYDKFFQQPMELFANAQVLEKKKKGRRNFYKIKDMEILKYVSIRESNALNFICLYIEKVIKDSELTVYFKKFFDNQNKNTYIELKEGFANFIIKNTKINGKTECGRIFTKVINPIAYKYNKRGTKKGRISRNIITRDMLMYNRLNWKDEANNKPKEKTRKEFNGENNKSYEQLLNYSIQKAKKILREYNDNYRNALSEVKENGINMENAIHMHHIFPKNEFPFIADCLENLIALTPTEHFVYAHPNGNTQYIDKQYQLYCLLCKINNVKENLLNNDKTKIYSFSSLLFVLNVGFSTDKFKDIEDMDFDTLLKVLDSVIQEESNTKISDIMAKYQ